MMSGGFRAVVTASAAAGIGVTAFTERPLLIGTVAVIAAAFAYGWPQLLGLPARRSATVVLGLTGAAAIALVVATDDMAWVTLAFGFAVLLTFGSQMLRRDGRPRLVEQVSGVVTGAAVLCSASAWLAIGPGLATEGMLLTAASALTAAAAVGLFTLPAWWRFGLAVAVGAGVGLGVGVAVGVVGLQVGLLIGLAAGLLVAAVDRLFNDYGRVSRVWPAIAAGALAVLVSGVPVYALGRALLHL